MINLKMKELTDPDLLRNKTLWKKPYPYNYDYSIPKLQFVNDDHKKPLENPR